MLKTFLYYVPLIVITFKILFVVVSFLINGRRKDWFGLNDPLIRIRLYVVPMIISIGTFALLIEDFGKLRVSWSLYAISIVFAMITEVYLSFKRERILERKNE